MSDGWIEAGEASIWAPAVTSLRTVTGEDGPLLVVVSGAASTVTKAIDVDTFKRAHRKALRERARLDVDDRSDSPKPLPAADPRDPSE
jgi:hypothetical protein